MAIDPAEIPTKSSQGGCPTVAIGLVDDLLLVDDSFERSYTWTCHKDDCTVGPVDFTGYTPTAQILDINGTVLDSFTVTPNPGDATGKYVVVLTPAQTTTTLRDNAVEWRLIISFGNVNKTLIKAPFRVT